VTEDEQGAVEAPLESVEEGLAEGTMPEEPGDEVGDLREKLTQAEDAAAQYLDGWRRAQAEFANYKKRQDTERSQAMALASAGLLRRLLPVVDDFERAITIFPESQEMSTWFEGLLLVKHKLDSVLEAEGVCLIEAEGQMFDPLYHEAVTHEQLEGYEEGQIIAVVQGGYMLGDRVLRPALVRVAKAPIEQGEGKADDKEEK
jgi:molecular chaperone GrpE